MWIVERANGVQSLLANAPDATSDGPILRQAEVDRAPAMDGSEDWDWDAGEWVVNVARAEAWIDKQHCMANGSESIAIAHASKELEARLFAAGITLDGVLTAEAAATGRPLADLVDVVLTEADTAKAAEVERIELKRAVRAE